MTHRVAVEIRPAGLNFYFAQGTVIIEVRIHEGWDTVRTVSKSDSLAEWTSLPMSQTPSEWVPINPNRFNNGSPSQQIHQAAQQFLIAHRNTLRNTPITG